MDRQHDRYSQFVSECPASPIFSQPWWLDAVCGAKNWSAAIAINGDKVIGAWPYCFVKKYGMRTVGMPPLTPALGPQLFYPSGQKQATRLTYEHEVYSGLLKGLPDVAHFSQYLHHSTTNVFPCIWNGFQTQIRYTYLLNDLSNLDNVFANFKSNIKTDIRKAMKLTEVKVCDDLHPFFDVYQKTFQRQKIGSPVSFDKLIEIDQACQEQQCRKIFLARDEQQRVCAGAYIVWDEKEVYYLMGGADPDLRNSGAGSLVVWQAIQFAAEIGRKFNFEGSMLPAVEPFFRAFGGDLIPYFHVWKTPSKLLRMLRTAIN